MGSCDSEVTVSVSLRTTRYNFLHFVTRSAAHAPSSKNAGNRYLALSDGYKPRRELLSPEDSVEASRFKGRETLHPDQSGATAVPI